MDAQCGGQSCCAGLCTDTNADRAHCGGCMMACEDSETCMSGECTPAMCSGEPGEPISDLDGGADDDGGAVPVFEDNGCPENEVCVDGAGGAVCQCGDGPGCPADETCHSSGECRCGSGDGCGADESCCDGECLDLQADEDNCGRCGRVCRTGTSCEEGECRCPNAAETACPDGCFNLQTDEEHCGRCGRQCATGATCNAGVCECDTAGEEACDGECVRIDTNQNCGECGNECVAGRTMCIDPAGSLPRDCYCPNVNHRLCGGTCRAVQTDENHCGECGNECATGATCTNGECECDQAGFIPCNGVCVNSASTANCGQCGLACRGGEACTNGECTCTGSGEDATFKYCDTGTDYECIPVTDDFNCGACGVACIGNSQCEAMTSGATAMDYSCECLGSDAGRTHCPGEGCVDTDVDEDNCGTCGNDCGRNSMCCNGTCRTAAQMQTDEDNCGGCGIECATGDICCGGDCYDADNNRDHCGACDNACADTGCGFFNSQPCDCNNGDCET
jgi:hypothetical protein